MWFPVVGANKVTPVFIRATFIEDPDNILGLGEFCFVKDQDPFNKWVVMDSSFEQSIELTYRHFLRFFSLNYNHHFKHIKIRYSFTHDSFLKSSTNNFPKHSISVNLLGRSFMLAFFVRLWREALTTMFAEKGFFYRLRRKNQLAEIMATFDLFEERFLFSGEIIPYFEDSDKEVQKVAGIETKLSAFFDDPRFSTFVMPSLSLYPENERENILSIIEKNKAKNKRVLFLNHLNELLFEYKLK